jgi:23S rRNA pseudouridine2605 synthase
VDSKVIMLSKYLAQAGVCSRRKAVGFIKSGKVKIDGVVTTEVACKITLDQQVKLGSQVIRLEKKVYLVLNKPEGYITTHSDQEGRQTVMDLVRSAARERLHSIGRLDRSTTGLLILTNDGDLTQKLAHPKNEIEKTYVAVLDKPLSMSDVMAIKKGVHLKDGLVSVDRIVRIGTKKAKISLHSGKYRVIRRLFKKFGYNVIELDRIKYAGLTKKGLKTGHWRMLTAREVDILRSLQRVPGQ